jgi:hypothetical protein
MMMTSSRSALLLLLAACVLGVLRPTTASAQQEYSYFAAYVGTTSGGDTTVAGPNFGFSTAYVTENNWGTELDVSHSTKFNDQGYEATGLTTAMINVLAIPRVWKLARPYGVFGAGIIRARGCTTNCVREFSRTDLGLDAGGGVYVPVTDFFGARADVRYFRYATIHRDLPRLDNGAFDFWRVSFGGVLTW